MGELARRSATLRCFIASLCSPASQRGATPTTDPAWPGLFTKVVEERKPHLLWSSLPRIDHGEGGSLNGRLCHIQDAFRNSCKASPGSSFDGGRLTSDGGLTWLAEVDKELGVGQAMAQHIPEWRSRRGRHSMLSLLKQRVYQIACGYEDQNDSDFLRSDPLLKLVCGALPESGEDLASQPTICR